MPIKESAKNAPEFQNPSFDWSSILVLQGIQATPRTPALVVILWSYRADRQAVVWAWMDIKCAPICGPAIFFPTAQQDQLTRVEGKFWRNLQILCQGGPSSPALATTGQHERWHDYAHTCKNSDFYSYYYFYYIYYYYFWLCANSDDMNVSHFPVFYLQWKFSTLNLYEPK